MVHSPLFTTRSVVPHSKEAALQQKALILGQEDNSKGMSDAFKQLLKEFPKTTVAAQANYYIGKAAFEAKDYKVAKSEDFRAARKAAEEIVADFSRTWPTANRQMAAASLADYQRGDYRDSGDFLGESHGKSSVGN